MIYKKDIEKLIVKHKKSSLMNHWKDALIFGPEAYSGEIRATEILLWTSTAFMKATYPVFHLTFDENEQFNCIKTEKNPFHKLLNIMLPVLLALLALILFRANDTGFVMIVLGVVLFFALALFFTLRASTIHETKLLTEALKATLQEIERSRHPELMSEPQVEKEQIKRSEWTLLKILTRILLYPFCLAILWFSISEFLPSGKVKLGVFGIIISTGYLLVDVLLIFGKKTLFTKR